MFGQYSCKSSRWRPFTRHLSSSFSHRRRRKRLQIIAMADSGLDQNSCFFREDSDDGNIECSTYTSPVYDLTKRKVSAKQLDDLLVD